MVYIFSKHVYLVFYLVQYETVVFWIRDNLSRTNVGFLVVRFLDFGFGFGFFVDAGV